jgi:tetratricopeptide (TPR) repeat protein
MSIFKRDPAAACVASHGTSRSGWLTRVGVLGLLAGCATLLSSGTARAVDSVVVGLIGNAVDVDDAHPYPEVSQAIIRFQHGDAESAEAILEKAKNRYKMLPPAEVMLAKLFSMSNIQNQAANVRAQLEKCVRLHPDDPEAYIIIATQALREGRLTEAAVTFAQGKAVATKFTENKKRQKEFLSASESGMAAVAEARQNWDEARAHLEAWLAVDPKSAVAHNRLARAVFQADKTDDKKAGARAAYAELKSAVEADPKSMSPDIGLALLYEEAGKHRDDQTHEDAVTFIHRAVTNLPADPDTRLATLIRAADWAINTDQPNEAKEYADMALKAQPDSAEAKVLRAVAARLLRDNVTAEKYLAEVYQMYPTNFAASNQYAQVLAEQSADKKKQDKALAIAQINAKLYGQGGAQAAECAATLGWVLYQKGEINQADQVMRELEKANAQTPDSLYYKAKILEAAGQPDNAVRYLKAALTLSKAFVHHREAQSMKDKLEAQLGTGETPNVGNGKDDTTKKGSAADEAGKSTLPPTTGTGK